MAVVLIYGFGIGIVAVLAILFYVFAVASRKAYVCPQCGEKVRVEHMDAKHCNMCGAPLGHPGGEE